MIRLLICGDREWDDYDLILAILEMIGKKRIEVVIHGACRGADLMADRAAKRIGIKRERYPAEWAKYGRAAGPIRNSEMLKDGKPTHVLAFHDDIKRSRGMADMVKKARRKKIPTKVISHLNPHIPPNFFPL